MGTTVIDPDVVAFFESDMPVSEWVAPEPPSDTEIVVRLREQIDRKFTASDIADGAGTGQFLYTVAERWLPTQTGADFAWLSDLAKKYARGGGLSDGQAAGVLNCMVAAEKRKQAPAPMASSCTLCNEHGDWIDTMGYPHRCTCGKADRVAPKVTPNALDDDDRAYEAYESFLKCEVSHGFYTVARPDGSHRTFKVGKWVRDSYRPGQQMRWIGFLNGADNGGDYRTCGRQLESGEVVLTKGLAQQDGIASELAVLFGSDVEGRAAMREAYAIASGRCARCNLMLTVPASIHRGLGPDCADKVGY